MAWYTSTNATDTKPNVKTTVFKSSSVIIGWWTRQRVNFVVEVGALLYAVRLPRVSVALREYVQNKWVARS